MITWQVLIRALQPCSRNADECGGGVCWALAARKAELLLLILERFCPVFKLLDKTLEIRWLLPRLIKINKELVADFVKVFFFSSFGLKLHKISPALCPKCVSCLLESKYVARAVSLRSHLELYSLPSELFFVCLINLLHIPLKGDFVSAGSCEVVLVACSGWYLTVQLCPFPPGCWD